MWIEKMRHILQVCYVQLLFLQFDEELHTKCVQLAMKKTYNTNKHAKDQIAYVQIIKCIVIRKNEP